jgi:hypothetical protein
LGIESRVTLPKRVRVRKLLPSSKLAYASGEVEHPATRLAKVRKVLNMNVTDGLR